MSEGRRHPDPGPDALRPDGDDRLTGRLRDFGRLSARCSHDPVRHLAFEVLRAEDAQPWVLRVPWETRGKLEALLVAVREQLEDGSAALAGEAEITEVASVRMAVDLEVVAVALARGSERALALWSREPAEDGWRWTADVIVVPLPLAAVLLAQLSQALRSFDDPPPEPGPSMLPIRPSPSVPELRRRNPSFGTRRGLRWLLHHLLSFETAFVLFLYSNELKTIIAFPFPVDETVLFGALAVSVGAVVLAREGLYVAGFPPALAAFAFVAWASLTAIWSPSHDLAYRSVAYLLTFTTFSIVAGALIIGNNRTRARRFFMLVLLIGVGMAVYGLGVYALYGDFRRWIGWQDWDGRAYLAFGHTVANGAGVAVAIALFSRFASVRQIAAGALLGLCMLFLLIAGGRGPFLGAVLAILLGIMTRPPEIGRDRLEVPATTLAATLMLGFAATYVAYLLLTDAATATLARFSVLLDEAGPANPRQALMPDRTDFYRAAYEFWLASPFFGNGLDSFSYLFTGGTPREEVHPHNIFLQSLCELGLVGLALLLLFLWISGRRLSFQRLCADPLAVMVLLFVVTSSMSALFGRDIVGVRKFFFAVCLLSLRSSLPTAAKAWRPVRRKRAARAGFGRVARPA